MNVSPDGAGGASVVFDLDSGIYSGHGVIDAYALPTDVYLGFTGRTGGATNNHWVKDVSVAVTPVNVLAATDFAVSGDASVVTTDQVLLSPPVKEMHPPSRSLSAPAGSRSSQIAHKIVHPTAGRHPANYEPGQQPTR